MRLRDENMLIRANFQSSSGVDLTQVLPGRLL